MKLSRLYSDQPLLFGPVGFGPGLNAVVAEIRLPQNKAKDTHNLGKSTMGAVIDFCLLKGRDARFFMFKHEDIFGGFTFFLELELLDGGFVTIRRSVDRASRISFKRHSERWSDMSSLPEEDWDHANVPIEKAVTLLDGILDLSDLKPWTYRKLVGYLLRGQSDYRDVFQLSKFKGKDSDWKPFLAQLLGFDARRIVAHYEKEADLEKAREDAAVIEREVGGSIGDLSKIQGLLLIRQSEVDSLTAELDRFDFERVDSEKTKELVDELDSGIGRLNAERYGLEHNRRRVTTSLEDDKILFDPDQAAMLFSEAGVVFSGQLKKDFDQLIAFNRAITEERRGYLLEELEETEKALVDVTSKLSLLGAQRQEALKFLADSDSVTKYKKVTGALVNLRADMVSLERQRDAVQKLQTLRARIRSFEEETLRLREAVEEDVEGKNEDHDSLFSVIRLLFNRVIEQVIDRKALLNVVPNNYGHLEFSAEILDEGGKASSADAGNTYRKLLCIALDLALLRGHLSGKCSRFVFHDGVFESLDDRKKENLLVVMREYASVGVQQVVTVIDSDLPIRSTGEPVFTEDEVVLRLHDEGDEGRLFRMAAW